MESRYTVRFCLDGDMERVVREESFDDWNDYDAFVGMLPYEIVYADDTTIWVDCSDELREVGA